MMQQARICLSSIFANASKCQVAYSSKPLLTAGKVMLRSSISRTQTSIRVFHSHYSLFPKFTLRCNHIQRVSISTIFRRTMQTKAFNISGAVKNDTLLFAHHNDNFFKIFAYFGIFQMGMWCYLSLFAFQSLKAVPVGVQDTSQLPWYKRLLYKQGHYKNALSLLSFIVGKWHYFTGVMFNN